MMGPMEEDFIDVVSNSAESFKMVSQTQQQQHHQQQHHLQQQQHRRESSSSLDRFEIMREAGSAFQPVYPSRGGSSR